MLLHELQRCDEFPVLFVWSELLRRVDECVARGSVRMELQRKRQQQQLMRCNSCEWSDREHQQCSLYELQRCDEFRCPFRMERSSYGGSMSALHVGAYAWSLSGSADSSSSCAATAASGLTVSISDAPCANCSAVTSSLSSSYGASSYGGSMSALHVGAYAWSFSFAVCSEWIRFKMPQILRYSRIDFCSELARRFVFRKRHSLQSCLIYCGISVPDLRALLLCLEALFPFCKCLRSIL